jgi:hypothetical protein
MARKFQVSDGFSILHMTIVFRNKMDMVLFCFETHDISSVKKTFHKEILSQIQGSLLLYT